MGVIMALKTEPWRTDSEHADIVTPMRLMAGETVLSNRRVLP